MVDSLVPDTSRNVPCTIRLYRPADWSGRLICWRLESEFCHATIQFGNTIYTATYPTVTGVNNTDTSSKEYQQVGLPPRKGNEYVIMLTPAEAQLAMTYCLSKVGTSYDILSALGWAFRIGSLQTRAHVYCFEYVYAALAHAGLFAKSKALITGDQLLVDLYHSGRLQHLDPHVFTLSLRQKPPR